MRQRIRTRLIPLCAAALLVPAVVWSQEPEITMELPGGVPLEMVWIEPGTFLMGSPDNVREAWGAQVTGFETPQHSVTITQGFYLGKFELTQEQWTAVMETHPWRQGTLASECNRCPAVRMTWNEIQNFIQLLNDQTIDLVFRLPTEAEWEYAAKAGTTTTWPFGDNEEELSDYAWYEINTDCSGDLPNCGFREVGLKNPNPWGLYDIYGNVWEWVADVAYRLYSGESQFDPMQTTPLEGWDILQVYKGGAFFLPASSTRPANRSADDSTFRWADVSIRLLAQPNIETSVTSTPWGLLKKNQINVKK